MSKKEVTRVSLEKVDSEKLKDIDDLAAPNIEPFRLSEVLFRRNRGVNRTQLDAVATEVGVLVILQRRNILTFSSLLSCQSLTILCSPRIISPPQITKAYIVLIQRHDGPIEKRR